MCICIYIYTRLQGSLRSPSILPPGIRPERPETVSQAFQKIMWQCGWERNNQQKKPCEQMFVLGLPCGPGRLVWVGPGSGAMTFNEILPGVRKAVASCVALEPSSYLHRFAVMVALSSMVFLCPAALSRQCKFHTQGMIFALCCGVHFVHLDPRWSLRFRVCFLKSRLCLCLGRVCMARSTSY